jgi:hypothetical protein
MVGACWRHLQQDSLGHGSCWSSHIECRQHGVQRRADDGVRRSSGRPNVGR